MPEMHFVARWPDNAVLAYYSPSLVVRDYLEADRLYALNEFVQRSRVALGIAAARVQEKYGFRCPRAARSIARIEAKAREFADLPDATVRIEAHSAGTRAVGM